MYSSLGPIVRSFERYAVTLVCPDLPSPMLLIVKVNVMEEPADRSIVVDAGASDGEVRFQAAPE